jgi:hypothetical protein
MAADFTFEVDRDRDLIRVVLSGFFAEDELHAFLDARRDAHAQLRCKPNQHLALVDIRGMKIQSQHAVEGFRDLLGDARYHARRLAFVVSPTLARSQLSRALASRAVRFFSDRQPAERWLLTGIDEAEAA